MATIVYGLCALTSMLCAYLLLRGYRQTRSGVLGWSALCFCGLALSNAILVADKLVFPDIDMQMWRLGITLASMLLLLFGLTYPSRRG